MQDHRDNYKTGNTEDEFGDEINREIRREPGFDSIEQEPDTLEEAVSAQYPEDAEEFLLAGDDGVVVDEEDWPLAEDRSGEGAWQPDKGEAETRDENEDEDEDEDEDESHWLESGEETDNPPGWPIGLIAVVVIALVLLAAGGYGVMQQRAETQEELRELRARLANSVTPEQAADERATLRALREENQQLQVQRDSLRRDNERLNTTVRELESQLQAQVEATRKSGEKAAQEKAAREKAALEKESRQQVAAAGTGSSGSGATAASGGDWFVNFSSYHQRATADSWANKLQPGVGRVVITTGSSANGTLYRVRVVGLENRAQAESVARNLEQQYGLEKLWVGRN